MEISDVKKAFLESLDIDLNNLPDEFKKFNSRYNGNVKSSENDFLFFIAQKFTSKFCMKGIVGTKHPGYENMSFFDSFLKTKRGDIMIDSYINNPSYYEKTLKQPDQSYEMCNHDTPIELYKIDDENYYVVGGNNRINLMMMLYLSDLSKAKTKEEKEEVYKKHTYYAVIKSLPKNKRIVSLINILKSIYKDIEFKFKGNNPDDCIYDISIKDKNYHINNYNELHSFFEKTYSLDDVKDEKNLICKLDSLFEIFACNSYETEVFEAIFIKISELRDLYIKAKNNNLLVQVNYKNLNYYDLFNQLGKIVAVFEINENKKRIEYINNYFINCKSIKDFTLLMDSLINNYNYNYHEDIFKKYKGDYQEFKKLYLEIRNYLLENHSLDVIEFTYVNIYNYMLRMFVEKKREEHEKKESQILVLENYLNDLKRKILIEENNIDYSITSSYIEKININKDKLENQKLSKEDERALIASKLSIIYYKIGEIKSENIVKRFFYLKRLRKLENEYDFVHSKLLKNNDELIGINKEIKSLSEKIKDKKQWFSLKLNHGLNFNNFKSEQERLKDYSTSKDELEHNIAQAKEEIIGLNIDLESDKLELEYFLKKHNVTDITTFNK